MKSTINPHFYVQCCVCKKMEDNGKWVVFPHEWQLKLKRDNVTHTYCEECFKDTYQKNNVKNKIERN